ncbi:serine/threonine-protein kinase 19 [Lingula anatina]|uniref:Serine/threonine-protein kinase 19 n=1 Tax=Lingula anatina TaxID=7574 RepID=A0A1S3JZU1_LINAN|nr:serine/threonine-protein kinase 19 [Lingula anatina]|eukprot:XP_013415910.1 serine/threonine-protein kinase 19 [Lingula anatina]
MSRKRSLLPDVYRHRKKVCLAPKNGTTLNVETSSSLWNQEPLENNVPNDTKATLLYLKNLFPVEKFEGRLPPIILKHQLYSILKNRTVVDKQLEDLRLSGEIRLFRLGGEMEEYCIVFTADYKSHVLKTTAEIAVHRGLINRFLTEIACGCPDVSVNKQTMINQYRYTDEEITQLVKASVLTVRDIGSWWVSIPDAGLFMKSFTRGRKAVLMMITKSKYKETLQNDLETRKLPKVAKLGMAYHIHDIIGADLVECISTSSGPLLRKSAC